MGVTGARKSFSKETSKFIKRIRSQTNLPLCVGFGISTPKQFNDVIEAGADGAVVGSAIIDIAAKNLGKKSLLKNLGNFIKPFSYSQEYENAKFI